MLHIVSQGNERRFIDSVMIRCVDSYLGLDVLYFFCTMVFYD